MTLSLIIEALRVLADGHATDAQLGDRVYSMPSAHQREAAARRLATSLIARDLATSRKDRHGRRVLLITVGGRDFLQTSNAVTALVPQAGVPLFVAEGPAP